MWFRPDDVAVIIVHGDNPRSDRPTIAFYVHDRETINRLVTTVIEEDEGT
jgi:hypothetical protein